MTGRRPRRAAASATAPGNAPPPQTKAIERRSDGSLTAALAPSCG